MACWYWHAAHCDVTHRRLLFSLMQHPCLPAKAVSAVYSDESCLAVPLLTDCHFLQKEALPCMPCLSCSCEAPHSIAFAFPLSSMAFLQRNVFADIIKRKEVMALPNLAEDLAYVSLLCVLGEDSCIASVYIDLVAKALCVLGTSWAM